MSNTMPPSGYSVPAPASEPRPGTVSAAAGLLYILALLSLVSVALTIYSASMLDADKVAEIYVKAGMDQSQAETVAGAAAIGAYIGALLPLLIGVLYLVLAIFVNKGKQWARITTWVVAGIAVCCNAFSLASNAASSALSGMGNTSGIDQAEVTKDLEALMPGWLTTTSMVLTVLTLLASIVVIVLLLLPPSNPYFRKVEPQWTPPAYPAP
jgi:uncharacterized protein YidB (DUF937 family)